MNARMAVGIFACAATIVVGMGGRWQEWPWCGVQAATFVVGLALIWPLLAVER